MIGSLWHRPLRGRLSGRVLVWPILLVSLGLLLLVSPAPSWAYNACTGPNPNMPEGCLPCMCPDGRCPTVGQAAHGGRPPFVTGGVTLYRGEVVICATDASQPGTTLGWCHQRIYGSRFEDINTSPYSGWNGMRWMARGEGVSLIQSGTDEVTLALSPITKLVFTDNNQDGTYDVPVSYNATLVKTGSGASERFVLTELDTGNVLIFFGYDSAISSVVLFPKILAASTA